VNAKINESGNKKFNYIVAGNCGNNCLVWMDNRKLPGFWMQYGKIKKFFK
jgi:hypothetical protein